MPIVQYKCADCAVVSPPTESQYSMLSMAGWRQAPAEVPGKPSEWRCPACWTAHKRRARAQTLRFLPRLDDLRRDTNVPSSGPMSRRRT
jgi:hypothetical protein